MESKVIIYSTTHCAFCKVEKQYLQKIGVEYAEKDIETDQDAYNELMQKMGGAVQGVPVTDIDGTIVVGFDRNKINDALKTKGLMQSA
jgi:mycoredoxin